MAVDDKNNSEAIFTSLILTLSSSAWIGLGKIADPVSGKINQDMNGAKYTIDLLLTLREKTKGNLNSNEEKLMNSVIADLEANYAETVFVGRKKENKKEKVESKEEDSKENNKSQE